MIVDLTCTVECYVDISGNGKAKYCYRGKQIQDVDINGDEGWLKYFNAYEPAVPVVQPEVKQIIIESIGVADKSKEEPPAQPTPQELGNGPSISLETIKEAFTKEELVSMLKLAGMKLASMKWKEETLAKHVQQKKLYLGKL